MASDEAQVINHVPATMTTAAHRHVYMAIGGCSAMPVYSRDSRSRFDGVGWFAPLLEDRNGPHMQSYMFY